jgi:hypothetical protein
VTRQDDSLEREYRQLALRNLCPAGEPRLQGQWKFVGQSKTPEFKATLSVDKTAYTEHLEGRPDGKALKTELVGEIRCLFKNRVLVMIDKVTPEGGFGNKSGEAFPCDILEPLNRDGRRILLICFFDWDLSTTKGLEFEYERVEK